MTTLLLLVGAGLVAAAGIAAGLRLLVDFLVERENAAAIRTPPPAYPPDAANLDGDALRRVFHPRTDEEEYRILTRGS